MHSRVLSLFYLLLIPLSMSGQSTEVWTLQRCIDHALEKNLQIRQSELNVDMAKSQQQQSAAGFFPSLNGSASQNHYYGRSIDPFTNTFTTNEVRSNSFVLSSSVSLFEGFQLQNTLRQSNLNYLSSRQDLKKVENDISLNVATLYLQVLYNQELIKVSTDQAEASRLQRTKIARMEELGAASRGNLLEMESQLSTDELRLIQAQAALDQSLLSLTQLLELESSTGFQVDVPLALIPAVQAEVFNVNGLYAAALNSQPEIKSAEFKVSSAEKGLRIAQGGRYPRLFMSGNLNTNFSTSSKDITGYTIGFPSSVFSGYTSNGDSVYTIVANTTPILEQTPFSDQLNNNLSKSFGFTLQVPLFNGWSVRNNVTRSRINLEQSKLNNEITRKNLYKSVQQAVNDALAAQKKFEASGKSAATLKETYEYNRQRFDVGLISSYEFLTAKNNYARAEADVLQAKYDYIFKLKILDFYQGKSLTF